MYMWASQRRSKDQRYVHSLRLPRAELGHGLGAALVPLLL